MKQQTYRRLFILLVAGAIMAMVWIYVGIGCDGTPPDEPPPPSDRVRRRATAVNAGSPGSNPPLLTDNAWKNLNTNDSVRTDQFGEAELDLDGCDGSLYVFDNSTLSVWTCTKQAEEDKEYWCVEEGSAGFNIDCTARFIVVDTPSAQVTIQATAFTVTYLPDSQLTLVTVLRGVVDVAPVLDMDTLELGAPVPVEEGFFLYTMPGEVSPVVGEVPAREPRPLNELPLIIYEIGIRGWIDDIARWGDEQQILPPSWPVLDQVTLAFDGGQLTDPRVQEAFVTAIDKKPVMDRAFPNEDIQFTARIGDDLVDAYTIPYDPEKAYALLEEAGYDPGKVVTVLFPEEDGQVAMAAKLIAGDLSRIGIPVELTPVPGTDLSAVMTKLASGGEPVIAVYR